jgi:hypothetical protein
MKRRINYTVIYSINYPSGKKWTTKKNVYALSEYGAIEVIKWLNSNNNIDIKSITANGYVGDFINEDKRTLGDF